MSDPIPKDEETEGADSSTDTGKLASPPLPPKNLPEELLQNRLSRLETRRMLAELCKNIPGLEEALLPRGIQADALTRKSGGSATILKGVSRRIMNDAAAWGAFRTVIGEQIPSETFEALENLKLENVEKFASTHTTEGLLLAALCGEAEPEDEVVEALIAAWHEEKGEAEKRATDDAHIADLKSQLEHLKGENEQLSFASRMVDEQVAALKREVEALHDELGQVVAERDDIRDALKHARFTDEGFGNLLVRAVKNEVSALPNSLDATARTAQLMEFMGSVLRAHAELREHRSSGSHGTSEETEDSDDPSQPHVVDPGADVLAEFGPGTPNGGHPKGGEQLEPVKANMMLTRSRPTLSFKALGGAGEVGGSSHFLDFGRTRVLVDAGIRPDSRGLSAPNFRALKGLDAVVVTHAHLDHCGALPLLVREQPDVTIYCTPPSAKLIASALNDHAAMGGGLPGGAPLHEVKKRLYPMPFGKPAKVGDAKITLTQSGHILGAASVLFETDSATVFHTGDICLEDHFSIPSARLPDVKDIDLLIMEATLADRKPQPFSESVRKMIEVINETTMQREGIVLIPTYALGQAQEIILGLKHYEKEYGLDGDVFIYVDGSVVTTSERLYAEQLGYMKPYLQHTDPKELFYGENIRAVANDDKARERILSNPCAIIASPVTMQGGASAFYRRNLQDDPANAVILPSNASASYGASQVPGEEEGWRVEKVSFAAHCTQDELLCITEKLPPRQIILIHGSRRRISDLAYRLAPNYKIHTPAVGETIRTVLQ